MIYRTVTRYAGSDIIEQYQEDVDWGYVRYKRDLELARTDWWAGKDVTLTSARKEYRIFLRDLPQNYESANDAADVWAAYEIPE